MSPLLELKIFFLFTSFDNFFSSLEYEFFLSIFFKLYIFKFSECLPINRIGQMKKGSVQFLVSLCEDITAWCQKWQISFQTSKLSSLLKELFTYWQFLVMAVDFISASWALTCRCCLTIPEFEFLILNFFQALFFKFSEFLTINRLGDIIFFLLFALILFFVFL